MGDSQNRGVSKQLFDSSGDVKDILPTPFKKAQGSMATDTALSKPLHSGRWQLTIPELYNSQSTEEVFKLQNEDWSSSIPLIESTINSRIHQEQRDDQNWAAVELDRVFGGLNAIGSTLSSVDQKVMCYCHCWSGSVPNI
jgi:hypothetical protein